MAKWIEVCGRREVPAGDKLCLKAGNCSIVLCDVDGEISALENICPHAGLPLGEGELRGAVLTCPYHGYAFNVRSGLNVDFPREEPPARTFKVKVEGNKVWVELDP